MLNSNRCSSTIFSQWTMMRKVVDSRLRLTMADRIHTQHSNKISDPEWRRPNPRRQ
jgi:hypothetical protein